MGNEDLAMLENLSWDATQKTQKDHDGIVIPISDENPWKNRLLVKVLGAWVNFRIIEAKLQRSWTKNDTIQIIDVQDGYYQVIFTSADDYKFALYEGPWMVANITR